MLIKRIAVLSAVIVLFFVFSSGCTRKESSGIVSQMKTSEKLLSPAGDFSGMIRTLAVSPDNTRVGYIEMGSNEEYAVIDGKKQNPYNEIMGKRILFSPDGKHAAYIARKDKNKVVVLDGKEGKEYGDMRDLAAFSSDGNHLIYAAETEDGWWTLVIDGKEGEKYLKVKIRQFFSPGSIKVVFTGARPEPSGIFKTVVVDGKSVNYYNKSYSFEKKNIIQWQSFLKRLKEHKTLSTKRIWDFLDPEGKKIISAWKPGDSPDEESKSKIINGINKIIEAEDFYEQKAFSELNLPRMTKVMGVWTGEANPDRSKFTGIKTQMLNQKLISIIFKKEISTDLSEMPESSLDPDQDNQKKGTIVVEGDKSFVVIDNSPMKKYDKIAENLAYNPVSKQLAYVAEEGKKEFVVFDGKEGKKYDFVGTCPEFSSDGKRMAYAVQEGKDQFIVSDGNEEKKYNGILKENTVLESDFDCRTKVFAERDKMFSVIMDKDMNTAQIQKKAMVFSPDGRRTAYAATNGKTQFAVIDGKEQKEYDKILTLPAFSPDGQHVAYVVQKGKNQFVVADGKEMKYFQKIVTWGGGKIIFDSPDNLRYLVMEKDGIYSVEEKL